jgi:hypothetical protein
MPLICVETGKIVMMEITTRTQKGEGDFHGTSQGTEGYAQPCNVHRVRAIDGTLLLETPTVAGRSICDSVCGRCGAIHAFSTVTRFVGLPPVLAVDFGARLPSLGKLWTPPFEQVHAPLQVPVPHGGDGLRVDHELAGFVELDDSHCTAYVRIGPNSLVACDNTCSSYAALPMAAEQISAFIPRAFDWP